MPNFLAVAGPGSLPPSPASTAAAALRKSASYCFGNERPNTLTSNPGPSGLPASSTTPGAARSMTSMTGRSVSPFPFPVFR